MPKSDPIVQEGDSVLRKVAKTVTKQEIGSPKFKKILSHMKTVLADEEFGVAIAAPQIGESLRIFIVSGKAFVSEEEESEEPKEPAKVPPDMVFINPKIIRTSKAKREMSEGCLSVRGKYGTVTRFEKATVRALNEKGKEFTYHGSGLIAHIFQHEIDHLDGVLYIDKAVRLEDEADREELRKKYPAGKKARVANI